LTVGLCPDTTTLSNIYRALFPTPEDVKIALLNTLRFLAKALPIHYEYFTNWRVVKTVRPHAIRFIEAFAASEFYDEISKANKDVCLELLIKFSFDQSFMVRFSRVGPQWGWGRYRYPSGAYV
jgi:hypothetical protein